MTTLDLAFSLATPQPIPVDHGYLLYSAVSRLLPAMHQQNGIALHPIRGRQIGNRQLQLCDWSCLTVRTTDDRIAELLTLAGKPLRLGGATLRVGVPRVLPLVLSPIVRSRLVTIKNGTDPDRFTAELRRQLAAIGVTEQAQPTLGKRRTIRIKDKEVVGYEVLIEALSVEESLALQEHGVGGRRHMTCGVFVAVSEDAT